MENLQKQTCRVSLWARAGSVCATIMMRPANFSFISFHALSLAPGLLSSSHLMSNNATRLIKAEVA